MREIEGLKCGSIAIGTAHSLPTFIALPDLMFWTGRANVVTKEPFLFFGVACLIYLFFSVISANVIAVMERRASRGIAPAAGGGR